MTNSTKTTQLLIRVNSLAVLTMLALLIMLAGSKNVFAQQASPQYSLKVTPEQCVAMRQGQNCYADVNISWTAQQPGDYCLHSSLQSNALQCWSNSSLGHFKQEIVTNKNITFTLHIKGEIHFLINKELEMAWVYDKSTRKNVTWRMF